MELAMHGQCFTDHGGASIASSHFPRSVSSQTQFSTLHATITTEYVTLLTKESKPKNQCTLSSLSLSLQSTGDAQFLSFPRFFFLSFPKRTSLTHLAKQL
jgi:hypothetical protein